MIKTARLFAFGAVAGAAALLSAAPAAKAQTDTFAQYGQTNAAKPFTLTNTGATSTLTANGSVSFTNFITGVVSPATLTFSAITPSAATVSGSTFTQVFATYSFTITSGTTNYLSGSGSNLILTGDNGAGSSTLQVSTPPASDVVFTSNVIDLTGTTERNFSIGLSGVTPAIGLGANGYINGFSASSVGTFAKNSPAAVPEPGMVTFALTSGAGLAGMVLRGRRKFKKAA